MSEETKHTCSFCEENARIKEIIDSKDTTKLIELVKELRNRVLHAEDDVCYYKSILDGSWVNAREILEIALAKCTKENDNG